MIDDITFLESYIKQRLPTVTVFQNADAASTEIDVQNEPGKPLSFVRLLLTEANAAAIRRDPGLANRVILTLEQALDGASDEPEALLDLRGPL